MRNKRKVLYLISGIFNSVVCGIIAGLGVIVLLMSGVIKKVFLEDKTIVDDYINQVVEQNSSYSYLLEYTQEQQVDYIMKSVYIMVILMFVIAVIYVLFAIINFKLRNGHDVCFGAKPWLRHVLVACSWGLMWLNVANITTTIAVYLKVKDDDVSDKLYTVTEDTRSWGV